MASDERNRQNDREDVNLEDGEGSWDCEDSADYDEELQYLL